MRLGFWVPLLLGTGALAAAWVGISPSVNIYDEGLILVGAERVAHGDVLYRDFYANYGPAQFYVVAALFKLFGTNILIERLWDTAVRALIAVMSYCVVVRLAGRWTAIITGSLVALLLAYNEQQPAYPVFPALLFTLVSVLFLLPVLTTGEMTDRSAPWRAGVATGVVALFRFDIGFAVCLAESAILGAAALSRQEGGRIERGIGMLWRYAAGVSLVFVPFAAALAAVGGTRDFLFDTVLFPARVYPRMRSLPFPPLHPMTLETALIYFPLLAWAAAAIRLMAALTGRESRPPWALALLLLLSALLYAKGLVRVSSIHMLLGIASAVVLLGAGLRVDRRNFIAASGVYVALAAAVAIGYFEARGVYQRAATTYAWIAHSGAWRLPGRDAVWLASCRAETGLKRLGCFETDKKRIDAVRFVQQHTGPDETILVGTGRHDKIFANDMSFYFLAGRLPVTKWHHYDPGLQSSEPVQREMVAELEARRPRYIVLESAFDAVTEPNDSALSSGVTLLDEEIRTHFQTVATFDDITVLGLNG